jgi:hypothetical protein
MREHSVETSESDLAVIQFKQSCIFCGKQAKLTKEHIFGQWLKSHVRAYSNHTEHKTRFRNSEGRFSYAQGRLHKKRPPYLSNLRLVCQTCNNGWMSRLQEDAKPILVRLIEGDWTQLEIDHGARISSWVTMACICMEFADLKTLTTLPETRKTFSELSQPANNWRVYAGRCDGSRDLGSFWHRGAYISHVKPSFGDICNVQSTVFYLGRSFFLLISSSSELLPSPDAGFAQRIGLRQLWPRPEEIGPLPLVYTHSGVVRTVVAFWETIGPIDVPDWAPKAVIPSIVFRSKSPLSNANNAKNQSS